MRSSQARVAPWSCFKGRLPLILFQGSSPSDRSRSHPLQPQTRTVNVYRLLMRDTMEEKVMGLQQFKLDMANAVVNQVRSATLTTSSASSGPLMWSLQHVCTEDAVSMILSASWY